MDNNSSCAHTHIGKRETRLVHSTDHTSEKVLGRAFLLIAAFSIAEVVGAILSNSLTLLADAGHMLLDAAALGLAWLAARLSHLPANGTLTYGYDRFQVLAALLNGLLLCILIVWIALEGIERIAQPQEILPLPALAIAVLGLLVNILAYFWLGGAHDNINVRAAALHVLGDILGSLSAIASALIVYFTGWLQADAFLALLVASILSVGTWRVLKISLRMLLEATPPGIHIERVREALLEVGGVADIHHLHLWGLTPDQRLATLHLVTAAGYESQAVAKQVKSVLKTQFGVDASTIQVEGSDCLDALSEQESEANG